jgi:hypothetical protein
MLLVGRADHRASSREIDSRLIPDRIFLATDNRAAQLGELLGSAGLGCDRGPPVAILELDVLRSDRLAMLVARDGKDQAGNQAPGVTGFPCRETARFADRFLDLIVGDA